MTTVAQMIEWMKTIPPDAIVKCKEEVFGTYERYAVDSDVDIDSCIVHDYTSEEDRIKYPEMAGKVFVYIEAA